MQHEVREHKLAGGARLLAVKIPNAITYYWASSFRAGYRFVNSDKYELPHLAEHLAFEGTKKYPSSLAFKSEIERDGTYYNASTGTDVVSYMFSGSGEDLARIIPINLSQIYEPLYRAENIAQERAVITQEMSRKKEDDSWRVGYLATHAVLPERNPEIEERIAAIGSITKEDLRYYHEQCYGTANTAFVLAGDYSDDEVAGVVARLNENLIKRPEGILLRYERAQWESYHEEVRTFPAFKPQQCQMLLQFIHPGEEDVHYPALRIIAALLTGGLSARLLRKAREAGLTYSISALVGMNHDLTQLSLSSQTESAKLQQLVELAGNEIASIGAGEYSDEELERAIGYVVGSLRRANQTPADYASWYGQRFITGRKLESPEERIDRLQAVSRKAIGATFKRYVMHDLWTLTLIGNGLEDQATAYRTMLSKCFSYD